MQSRRHGRRFVAITFVQVLAATTVGVTAAEAVESRFDTDTEGWTIIDNGGFSGEAADYSSQGGFIFHEENLFATDDWYFRAPAKFRGNFSASYGTELTFDLRQSASGEDFSLNDIYLRGGGYTLTLQTDPPGVAWTAYSIPLVETGGWQLNNRAPTRAEMLNVLADLTDLQIRGEFQFGADEGALDNVVLMTPAGPEIVGDYDRDGSVDGDDYQLWRTTFGSSTILLADGNASGVVDLADYTVWRDRLGAAALPKGIAQQSIPEPAAWSLGLLAAAGGLLFKWLV